jgi:gamma-glutamyltranspeptidase/glutathione hydrolase
VRAGIGGLSNGVPGVIAAMQRLVNDHGNLEMSQVVAPAVKLAVEGFPMYTGMYDSIISNMEKLSQFEATCELFLNPECNAPKAEVGELFFNPDIAGVLTLIAEDTDDAFYRTGSLPTEIVDASKDAVNNDNNRFGVMVESDLAGYRAVYREPVVTTYRGYTVLGMPPPSSGGIAMAQMLYWMEGYNIEEIGPENVEDRWSGELITRWIDAQNAAFADRNLYVGDADFVDVPVQGLVDKSYNDDRRDSIADEDGNIAPWPIEPGVPEGATPGMYASSPPTLENGTTHASVSDKDGTIVAFTTTIEAVWGSGVVVPNRGFLLNNEMTDFQATGSAADGNLYANRPEGGKKPRTTALGADAETMGGKRPRSSMTPTILLDADGRPLMATGAPGGATIIAGTANVVLQAVDFGVGENRTFPATDDEVAEVTDAPRFMSQNGNTATHEVGFAEDYPEILDDAIARGCVFGTPSNGIALVQTVVVVPESDGDDGRYVYAGACDSKRQYQGEDVCTASGLCPGGTSDFCVELCDVDLLDYQACVDECVSVCNYRPDDSSDSGISTGELAGLEMPHEPSERL